MDVSVIIPVKNGEKYLRECLDSVFNQSFKGDYEVIINVNPSTDKTLEIANEYAKSHPLVVLENKESRTVQQTRMTAVRKATGKYICFLDSDDYLDKDFLKIMFEEAEKGFDIVNCSFKTDKDGKVQSNVFIKEAELDSYQACSALLRDTYVRSFQCTKIIKRELYDANIPVVKKQGVLFEDALAVYYAFLKSKKVKSITKPLYIYRSHKSSATKQANPNRFINHLQAFCYIRYLIDNQKDNGYLRGFLKNVFRMQLSLWYDGHISRKVLGYGGFKALRLHKKIIKELKTKGKFDYTKFPEIDEYIKSF